MPTDKPYDLLITGGLLLNTDTAKLAPGGVAIRGDRIAAIEDVPEDVGALRRIDATGLIVTPGIIDLHTHVAGGLRRPSPWSEDVMQGADSAGVHSGVTTVLDAGSCGIANIGGLVNHVIPNSKTRVLALLNVGSVGVNRVPEVTSAVDIDHDAAVAAITSRPDVIVGVKARMVSPGVPLLGIELPRAGKAIADEAGVRLMVHMGDIIGQSDEAMEIAPQILSEVLTEGDIVTHSFSGARGALLGSDRELLSEALDARDRGVLFDIGVGGANFSFDAAKRVMDGGLIPDTISSDVTLTSRYAGPAFSLMDCIGKVMSLGISLEDALVMSCRRPAEVLGPEAKVDLGCMAPGTCADLSLLRVHEGEWEFVDGAGVVDTGKLALEPVVTIRGGEVMPIDYGPRPNGWLPPSAT